MATVVIRVVTKGRHPAYQRPSNHPTTTTFFSFYPEASMSTADERRCPHTRNDSPGESHHHRCELKLSESQAANTEWGLPHTERIGKRKTTACGVLTVAKYAANDAMCYRLRIVVPPPTADQRCRRTHSITPRRLLSQGHPARLQQYIRNIPTSTH